MNQYGRDRKRYWHRKVEINGIAACFMCSQNQFFGGITKYPCDVTLVLDAWESQIRNAGCAHDNDEWKDCEAHADVECYKTVCLDCGITTHRDCERGAFVPALDGEPE
jgi:hypothetical protein